MSARPGKISVSGGGSVIHVPVPDNVYHGELFEVYPGSRIVQVSCPPDSRPGQSVQITFPVDPLGDHMALLTGLLPIQKFLLIFRLLDEIQTIEVELLRTG